MPSILSSTKLDNLIENPGIQGLVNAANKCIVSGSKLDVDDVVSRVFSTLVYDTSKIPANNPTKINSFATLLDLTAADAAINFRTG